MASVVGERPVAVALIGSGRMGSFHGETLSHRLSGVQLAAVVDRFGRPGRRGPERRHPTDPGDRRSEQSASRRQEHHLHRRYLPDDDGPNHHRRLTTNKKRVQDPF